MDLKVILDDLIALVPVFDPKDASKVYKLTTVLDSLEAMVAEISEDKTVWPAVIKLYEDSREKSGI